MKILHRHPQRIGILLNPHSGRVRRDLARFRLLVCRLPATRVAHVHNPVEIEEALTSWALTETDLLVVVGGDGTLQAALTSLLRTPGMGVPRVLVVPAGTTNMSASALGLRGSPFKIIKALARWLNLEGPEPRLRPTAVLQVLNSNDQRVQCGMFFGAGSIVAGVRYFHERIRPTGLKGVMGPLTAFVRMLLALFSRNAQRLLPTVDASITVDRTTREAPWLLVMGTTLDRLLLGSTPFWGTEHAPMRFTAISKSPARLCRALPAVLRGRPSAAMREDPGYLSHNVHTAGIERLSEYLLDGEIFEVTGNVELKASTPVCFLTL
ncbi:acylglycerol kinase family protein [Pseudomonas capeferrum]|uniref:diacylglycerol/lipid kinase family protein n=1 Tax=Pseudomonas capeferrum TaxID=1495066 RepID=UPI0015E31E07|nr:acylglycerol kinase family protein [Pseudomonas capeferrum]MBA1200204.1 acylglycerol kinase family protein [Pseudomonas capeferrum]